MEFEIQLEQADLKITPPRLAILKVLSRLKNPATINEIFARLKKTKIDLATLYRTLEAFEKAGLVEQIDFRQGCAYYELKNPDHDHHHLVCLNCKKIEELEGCGFSELSSKILKQAPNFANITHHSFEFFGTCRACLT